MTRNEILELPLDVAEPSPRPTEKRLPIREDLAAFSDFGKKTERISADFPVANGPAVKVDYFINEFWTAKQRAANSLHEVSYRACFKPQLPRFFIERLTQPGEVVYDPFMGR